jgi:Glycosyl transferase family 2
MKLVQTLVVRDEADIVGAQIDYHLNAGVDFVIATDHESKDGTTDILESYARDGYLLRIPESGEVVEAGWRTRMARLAATDYGADWVINTDADEFWMPRGTALKDALFSVPEPYGVVWALSRHFVPRPDDGAFFAERMTVRVSAPAAINDPTSPYRPHLKAAHRADPDVGVAHGSHGVFTKRWRELPHWHPCDVLHFPFRSTEQWERKGVRRARGDKPLGQYVRALHASEAGRAGDVYRALLVDDAQLERGLASGSLVEDTRLRDALRARSTHDSSGGGLSPSPPDRTLIAEGAGIRDADLVRLFRHLDGLRTRVRALEDRAGRSSHD